jgi:hypothetical protein
MTQKPASKLRLYIRSLLREMYVSHTNEPSVGDNVINTNPNCMHHGSEGVVLAVGKLPSDMGKTATYQCTNAGDNWSEGDVLTKTLDQLSAVPPR